MNILSVSVLIVSLCLGVLILVSAYHLFKKSKITHGVSVMASTGPDEKVTFNVNFQEGEEIQAQYKKLNQLCELADQRRKESFEKYQAAVDAEIAKKSAEKSS